MKEILMKLEFVNITGPLWKHESIGIIQVMESDDIKSIVTKIYDRGYKEAQLIMRSAIGLD